MTSNHKLRALDAINSLWLWMVSMTLGHEKKGLVALNRSGL